MDPSLTVLFAEDDENDIYFMQRAFHSLGIMRPLHIVRDGVQAIDYLSGQGDFTDRTAHPAPNYVILDLKMPAKDGFQVLQYLKEHPELLVIPTLLFEYVENRRERSEAQA